MDELRPQLTRIIALVGVVVACGGGQPRHSTLRQREGTQMVVDSIRSAAESIDLFFGGAARPESLSGGAESPAALARAFLTAISSSDTVALSRMRISPAEYAALYYPTSVYSRKPYELAPDIAWFLNSESSDKGARRLVQRLGGRALKFESMACAKQSVEGVNRIASDCTLTYRTDRDSLATGRLFSSLIQRGDEVKFLSYAGDF